MEVLRRPHRELRRGARRHGRIAPFDRSVLSRTYPQAVAGRPTSMSFDPTNGAFHLVYIPDHAVHAPTVVFVPTQVHYPSGYCARANGARVISKPGSEVLLVQNARAGRSVTVSVTSGMC